MKLVDIKHPVNILTVIRTHSIELDLHYRKIYQLFSGCSENNMIFFLLYELEAEFSMN